jgi:hypothetical protein
LRVDLVHFIFADEISDRLIGDHDLHAKHAALSAGFGDEGLRNDALEDKAELGSNLCLLVRRKDIDDPVNRLWCILSVEGCEYKRPVSAALMASEMVSRSRISPTRITSGSCLKACLRALLN